MGVGGSGWGGQGGCEWRSEAFVKIKKIIEFWGGRVRGGGSLAWGLGGGGGGGQGGWERRIEAFVKIQKNKYFFFFWGGGVGSRGVGLGQGGCERRSKVFVRIQKKKLGGGGVRVGWGSGCGGGVRVDVNGEVKLL